MQENYCFSAFFLCMAEAEAAAARARAASPQRADPSDIMAMVFGNGPVEVGLAVGADKIVWSQHGPIESADATVRPKCYSHSFGLPNVPAVFKPILQAAWMLAMDENFDREVGFQTRKVTAVPNGHKEWSEGSPRMDESHVQMCVTLIAATKVNWWMMNHHVGSGEAQGYVAKVLKTFEDSLGLRGASPAMVKATVDCIWQFGHWFSTREILRAFGVLDGTPAGSWTRYIAPTDDLMLRLRSCPAGTAAIADAYTALRMFASSMYALAFAIPSDAALIARQYNEIRNNPASYHVGARFLTGGDRNVVNAPEQDTIDLLGIFLAVVREKSSLRNAQVFKGISDATNTEIALRMKGIRKAQLEAAEGAAKLLTSSSTSHLAAWDAFRGNLGLPGVDPALLHAEHQRRVANGE